jgi:NTP pyrophosphatase (non-canonical NTP hydrolase)
MTEKYRQLPKIEIESNQEWGFNELQKRVDYIYKDHDIKCDYGPDTMLAKLMGNVITLTHVLRKTPNELETINRSLTNVFIWTTSVANIADINMQEIIKEKFGEGCPHCKQMPCFLVQGERCEKPLESAVKINQLTIPTSLSNWQEHLKKMYSNNYTGDLIQSMRFCSNKVLEETGELIGSAYADIEKELNGVSFDSVLTSSFKSEMADLIAWSMAVANCLDVKKGRYSIEISLNEKYKDGCPYCKSPKCICKKEKTFMEELKNN